MSKLLMCYDCRNKSDDEDLLQEIEEMIKNEESICLNKSYQQSKESQSDELEMSMLSTNDKTIKPSYDNLNKDFYYWALRYMFDKNKDTFNPLDVVEEIKREDNIITGFEI